MNYWGYGGGPCGPFPPPQYIQVPPNTDIERAIKVLEHLEKKRMKKELKDKEEAKKKEHKPKQQELPKVSIVTAFLWMCVLGLPVGYVNLTIMQTIAEAIKAMVK